MMFQTTTPAGPVAAYIRVSTDEQAARDTPAMQRSAIANYCAQHNLTVFDIYADDITGKLPLGDRPEGKRLLQDAAQGRFSHVIIFKLDRFARSLRVLLDGKEELDKLGIGLISCTEAINTRDPVGDMIFKIIGIVSEWEAENIRLRMRGGKMAKASQGVWIQPIVPYGLQLDENRRLVPWEPEHRVLQEFFTRIDAGETQLAILADVNSRGEECYSTRKVHPQGDPEPAILHRRMWTSGGVAKLLRNRIYRGEYRYNDVVIPDAYAPAIDPALFDRVQARLDGSQQALRGNAAPALVSGMLTCAGCGLRFHRWERKSVFNGKSYSYDYYQCQGRRYGKNKIGYSCDSKLVRVDELDTKIWETVESWARDIRSLEDLISRHEEHVSDLTSHLAEQDTALTQQLHELGDEKQEVLRLARKKLLNSVDLERQLMELGREEEKIQLRLNTVRAQLQQAGQSLDHDATTLTMFRRIQGRLDAGLTLEEKRKIVREVLKGGMVRTVGDGRDKRAEIELEWVFDTSAVTPSSQKNSTGIKVVTTHLLRSIAWQIRAA
jgi:site-specific DNA recombinase